MLLRGNEGVGEALFEWMWYLRVRKGFLKGDSLALCWGRLGESRAALLSIPRRTRKAGAVPLGALCPRLHFQACAPLDAVWLGCFIKIFLSRGRWLGKKSSYLCWSYSLIRAKVIELNSCCLPPEQKSSFCADCLPVDVSQKEVKMQITLCVSHPGCFQQLTSWSINMH